MTTGMKWAEEYYAGRKLGSIQGHPALSSKKATDIQMNCATNCPMDGHFTYSQVSMNCSASGFEFLDRPRAPRGTPVVDLIVGLLNEVGHLIKVMRGK